MNAREWREDGTDTALYIGGRYTGHVWVCPLCGGYRYALRGGQVRCAVSFSTAQRRLVQAVQS